MEVAVGAESIERMTDWTLHTKRQQVGAYQRECRRYDFCDRMEEEEGRLFSLVDSVIYGEKCGCG